MSLQAGLKLGPYEILEPIGKGGMGEVYRARDTKLDRDVAVKVLPEEFASDGERLARFEREAKLLASLNHPNICTIHDIGAQDGIDYLVMECIEGETLSEQLKKGALGLERAIQYGVHIADGLDKAHRAGIVHRDLKPGNIMLTTSGVKLLDFGLARLIEDAHDPESSDAPTREQDLTGEEAIIGTLQYMAPEQLERTPADARTDIFAFGALLYEALTGQKAFAADTQASLISNIMSSTPPPVSQLQPRASAALDRTVGRCLAKDPEDRWQSARDIVLELRSTGVAEDERAGEPRPHSRFGERLGWAAALLAVAGLAAWWSTGDDGPPPSIQRLTVTLPLGDQLREGGIIGITPPFAVSQDGQTIVYVSEGGAEPMLYLRQLDALEPIPIAGTEGARSAWLSPDGQHVVYRTFNDLQRKALAGGAAVQLAEFEGTGASWGVDGAITVSHGSGLWRTNEGGRLLETVVQTAPPVSYSWPQWLPDREHMLVTVDDLDGRPREGNDGRRTALVSTTSGEERTLLEGYGGARIAPSGHILVGDFETNSLFAARFDLESLEVHGEPVPVVRDLSISLRSGFPHYSVANNGTLVYAPAGSSGNVLVWVDRQGSVVEELRGAGVYSHPRVSPEGTRIAVDIISGGARDIWVLDLTRGTRTRLTDRGASGLPSWTPDGQYVSFYYRDDEGRSLFRRRADGSTEVEQLVASNGRRRYPISWSPDGKRLAYAEDSATTPQRDIFVLPVGGEPEAVLTSPVGESSPKFSPDGRYLAYVSDESGRNEVYVRSYPEDRQKVSISNDGGEEPVWSRDGTELFYREGYAMMAVRVQLGETFAAARPEKLFDTPFHLDAAAHPAYDVSADGQKFLMIQDEREERASLVVVLHWFAELERLVPTND